MKIHFGFIYGASGMEFCCDTACGCESERALEEAVDDWGLVTCKKCLRNREKIEKEDARDEEAIVQEMGDFVDFQNKTGKYAVKLQGGA